MFTACGIMHRRCCLLMTRIRWNWLQFPADDQDQVELFTVPPDPGHQQAASTVHYTTSCKHSLVLVTMGEITARNMLCWLKLLIKLLLLHLVGCLYYCIFFHSRTCVVYLPMVRWRDRNAYESKWMNIRSSNVVFVRTEIAKTPRVLNLINRSI